MILQDLRAMSLAVADAQGEGVVGERQTLPP
jgi:hypothetical protein